jgi:hypothetical protein
LLSPQSVERIVVWNRTEAGERLEGFRVLALDEARKPVWEKAGNPVPKREVTFDLTGARELAFDQVVADFVQKDFDLDSVLGEDGAKKGKTPAKKGGNKGWAVGGATGKDHTLTLLLDKAADIPAGASLIITLEQESASESHTLGRFRLRVSDDARVHQHVETPTAVLAGAVPRRGTESWITSYGRSLPLSRASAIAMRH